MSLKVVFGPRSLTEFSWGTRNAAGFCSAALSLVPGECYRTEAAVGGPPLPPPCAALELKGRGHVLTSSAHKMSEMLPTQAPTQPCA